MQGKGGSAPDERRRAERRECTEDDVWRRRRLYWRASIRTGWFVRCIQGRFESGRINMPRSRTPITPYNNNNTRSSRRSASLVVVVVVGLTDLRMLPSLSTERQRGDPTWLRARERLHKSLAGSFSLGTALSRFFHSVAAADSTPRPFPTLSSADRSSRGCSRERASTGLNGPLRSYSGPRLTRRVASSRRGQS